MPLEVKLNPLDRTPPITLNWSLAGTFLPNATASSRGVDNKNLYPDSDMRAE